MSVRPYLSVVVEVQHGIECSERIAWMPEVAVWAVSCLQHRAGADKASEVRGALLPWLQHFADAPVLLEDLSCWVHIVLVWESLAQVPALGYELLHLLYLEYMHMQKTYIVEFAAQQFFRLLGHPSDL